MTSRLLPFTLASLLATGMLLTGCSGAQEATGTTPPSLAPSAGSGASQAPTASPEPTPSTSPSPIPKAKKLKVNHIDVISITPNSGKYGVAMPIQVVLNQDIPKKNRALVESMMTVKTSQPVTAAWTWVSSRTMILRPQKYWPANTTITVDSRMHGPKQLDLKHKKFNKYGGGDTIKVRIGRSQVTKVDSKTHYAVVYRNGKKIRSMPVSLGKPGWETRSGTKVVMERYRVKRMTSQAVGDTTTTYDLQVPYSVRITSSGEFMHGAPWATGRLGRWNGSHGCTNLNMSDAAWFFNTAVMGDPVVTTHTGRAMESGNGLGGPWNIRWRTWLANSATGEHLYGPDGVVDTTAATDSTATEPPTTTSDPNTAATATLLPDLTPAA